MGVRNYMDLEQIKCRDDFVGLIDRFCPAGIGIEIGVEKALFSKVLLKSKLDRLYLVDAWQKFSKEESVGMIDVSQRQQDANHEQVLKDMGVYGDRSKVVRGKSVDVLKTFDDCYFDFVYIDANHDYIHAKEDINVWYDKVKHGGIFAGHDYLDGSFRRVTYGVKSAVDEFCLKTGVKLLITTEKHNPSWYLRKP